MSEILVEEEEKEENPSEPLPDVPTVAEAGQPAEPDETVETHEPQVASSSTNGTLSIEKLEKEASTLVYSTQSLSRKELHDDKLTQTFFKYMKNLSDNRCVEIFNMRVDYEDKTLLFYRKSSELLNYANGERNRIE